MLWEDAYKHRPYVKNIALKLCRNPVDAADVEQEVMIVLLQNIDKIRHPEFVRTWFYRVTKSRWINMLNKKKEVLSEYPLEDIPHQTDTNNRMQARQELLRVYQYVRKQKFLSRKVFFLTVIKGMRYETAAKRLKIPCSTLGTLLARLKLKIKKHFEMYERLHA